MYTFIKEGMKFVIRSLPTSQRTSIAAATQAKTLVNACEKFTLLVNKKKIIMVTTIILKFGVIKHLHLVGIRSKSGLEMEKKPRFH